MKETAPLVGGASTGSLGAAGRLTLTACYLDEVARRGGTEADLLEVMPAAGPLASRYEKRYLSRPLFLGHAEATGVNSDLQHIRAALASLPGLLYGGDLAAFAGAAGLTPIQSQAALRTQASQLTSWARADMYPDDARFRLLEFNMGSGVSGSEGVDITKAMLRYPPLREFARARRLTYVDTGETLIRRMLAESGFTRESGPMIALIDWPEHYERISGFLHKTSRRWRATGLDTHAGHLGQLKFRNGRVWLRGRPVDILFRIFLSEHLLQPGGPELMSPVIDAAARGEVQMFTPLDSELYGSKAPLAMLSDHANRDLFTPAQRGAIDRVLPWTRMLRPGKAALEDGSRVDLLQYALDHPADLVLKPDLLHGGAGVVAGWDASVTARDWRDALHRAMGGPYVLQRRVRVTPELCPGEDVGELIPWEATWGFFLAENGPGGAFARAFRPQPGTMVGRVGTHLRLAGTLIGPPAAG